MDNVFANTAILQWLLTLAAGALVLISAAALGAAGLKLTAKQGQQARFYLRQYYPTIRAQVDQRTDTIPTAADKIADKIIEADWDALLSTFLLALVDAGYQRAGIPPAVEVNIAPPVEAVPSGEKATWSGGPIYTPPATEASR
jgi:hypothetical protein